MKRTHSYPAASRSCFMCYSLLTVKKYKRLTLKSELHILRPPVPLGSVDVDNLLCDIQCIIKSLSILMSLKILFFSVHQQV